MKAAFLTLVLFVSGSLAYASNDCLGIAVRTAKENTFSADIFAGVQSLPVNKNYLVAYRTSFVDSLKNPKRNEVIDVVLMRSDCSAVSVTPRF